ncbi:hypothetical protein DRW03_33295 [Corallococcus sp. H22C18031201]|uniref:hypothetical protein n=1 Tax=Citreicoccus inhibens TaxID=2849499 RepID=UPI000E74941F|nr:hypothetical protein [Citreicoccus inhibens]MBU8898406.1 hypothetical protein [Citreicoccus inhibens]RJS15435.1 hypothetical protein DRW03_33295 [Corallococcus sp. H22C18031201]
MSDDKVAPQPFGQVREVKKNPKVFGVPVKIDPYTSVRPEHPTGEFGMPTPQHKKKDEKFDPFSIVIESPKGGT